MHEPAVNCQHLFKTFDSQDAGKHLVVNDVSFAIAPGQILALLGPSGCGKTTTLRLIAGFETLDKGLIEIGGQMVANGRDHLPPEKRRVGMVFQDYAIFPHLSVAKNIAFGLGRDRNAAARTQEMLDLVGLSDQGDKLPHELSAEQPQRVALARALAMNPTVVLLDEPFSNLDTALRTQVRREVRTLLKRSNATAIFVTHDQEEAMYLGDQIGVMNLGRVEQIGSPEAIFHRPQTRFVAEFMGQTDFVRGQITSRGIETPLGMLPPAKNVASGSAVEVAVRPDDVLLSPTSDSEANGRVVDRHFIGIASIYEVVLSDGTLVHSWQPHTVNLAPDSAVVVSLATDHPHTYFQGNQAVT